MAQASTTEPAFNVILGEALRQKHPLWTQHLGAEQTQVIVSIASVGSTDQAFSADTGMGEVLVVATKKHNHHPSSEKAESSTNDVQFANLRRRPVHHVAATEVAKSIEANRKNTGDGRISLGDEHDNGSCISTGRLEGGCVGIVEAGLASVMLSLAGGVLIHPRTNQTKNLPITTLSSLSQRGLVDRDLIGVPLVDHLTKSRYRRLRQLILHYGITMLNRSGHLSYNRTLSYERERGKQNGLRAPGNVLFPGFT